MSYTKIINDIQELEHYREFICPNCGQKQIAYILAVYKDCENCGVKTKLRGYAAIGSEIEDVIDAVLGWIGDGVDLDQALRRKKEIGHRKKDNDIN